MISSPSSRSETPFSAPFWGRIESLWLIMGPLCALLYTLCLPLAPNDLWYHVRAGELISRGTIPTQNLMSNGIPLDTPYYYQSWLAELGLFWTLQFGGLSGLVLLRAFCVAGALGLATAATFRALLRSRNRFSSLVAARLTALASVVGLAMFSNNVDLRPQTFSTLLFGAWLFAILEFRAQNNRTGRLWAVFLVILTLVWANTHGAFIISVLGLAALAASDFLTRRERFPLSMALTAAGAVAALVNPRGAALYAYVADLSRDQISQKWIQEWKSPGLDDWHSTLFWLVSASIPPLWFASHRLKKTQMNDVGLGFVLVLLWVMAARDQRSIIWFALAAIPVLATLATNFISSNSLSTAAVPRAAQRINAVLLLLLLALPLALLPQVKADWPWPTEFKRRFAPTPAFFGSAPGLVLENTTPVVAAQWLMKNPPHGRLFTDMVCGSYLTYAGRGQVLPWCDPRIELFPVAFWEDYLRLSAGPADAAAILEQRGFSDALLDRKTMPLLVKRLRDSPRWRIVAQNGSTLLFRNHGLKQKIQRAIMRWDGKYSATLRAA